MRWICVIMIALLSAQVLPSSSDAGGFALSGVGSKAIGMGGAFRGLADDYSAAYWNPAGLAFQEGTRISLTGIVITANPKITPALPVPGYRVGKEIEPKDEVSLAPNVSILKNFSGLNLGLSVYVPYGLSTSWDLYDLPQGYGNTNPYPEYDWSSSLKVIDVHPTVAKSFMGGMVSVGAGLSLQYGNITLQKIQFKSSELKNPGTGDVLFTPPSPFDRFVLDSNMEGSGTGIGGNAGILLKPLPILGLGIAARSGITMKIDGDTDLGLYLPKNTDISGHPIFSKQAPEYTQLFATGALLTSKPKSKADLKLPPDVGVGVAVSLPLLPTVTADILWTGWSSLDSIAVEMDGNDPLGSPMEDQTLLLRWEDTVRYSLGIQYPILPGLSVRGGYYFDPSPIPDGTLSPLIPDIGDKSSFNLGLGLSLLGLVSLDLNYEYIVWQGRTTSIKDVNGDGEPDNMPGKYDMTLNSFMATASVRLP